jgi:hypothetical protein
MPNRTSLSALVSTELENHPILLEFLLQGLGNVSAAAEHLRPALEARLGRKISNAAIGMALRRHLEGRAGASLAPRRFPAPFEVTTRSEIYEVAIRRDERGQALIDRIRKTLSPARRDFLSIAEGSYEIVIFTNQHNKPKVRGILGRHKRTSELDRAAYVAVNWPPETKDIPGIYYRVTRALAWREISIQSFHTIGAEMMIFVKREQLQPAYETLTRLLEEMSKSSAAAP